MPNKYKLIIKEHPRNIGRRRNGYYKKILNIPNVDFVDFELPSIEVISRSKLVIVLSGNIGFESVLCKVPVITLGNSIYNMLPKNIVNHLNSMNNLHFEINDTIAKYCYSDDELTKYIGAIIKHSFQLDLYTVLLRKSGREGGSTFNEELYFENIEILSSKIMQFFKER